MPKTMRRKAAQTRKTTAKKSNNKSVKSDPVEIWAIVTFTIGLIFGVLLYSTAAGSIGLLVKTLVLSIFGVPSYILPIMLAGAGVYLFSVRDYDRFYT
mgnify:CR=1 FL=1